MTSLAALRPHQLHALDGLRDALRTGNRRVVLQAPTGMGKTVLSCHIIAGLRQRGKRVVFCVPAVTLVDQTISRLIENGFDLSDIGAIQADHPLRRPHAPIQVATAQTLGRRDFPITDFVIIDEAHIRNKAYDHWMDQCPGLFFIGLSATPWARGMGKRWQCLVRSTTTGELIERGFLAPFRVFAPAHPDLSGVKIVAGDYHEGQLAGVMNDATLVADIVTTWINRGEDRPTLCFATGRDHAKAIHDRFGEFGVPAAYVDAFTPRSEREAIGQRLAAGEIKVVCNIGTLTTGIDWDVRCIILARPTRSRMLFVQMIGRGLRTAQGKADLIILDHSDTHERLGMVTDIDQDELDDGKPKEAKKQEREKSTPLPKCCPSCTALMPAGERACLACGHEMPRPIIETVEGELVEFGSNKKREPKRKVDALADRPKAEVYGELLSIQIERKRSPGWLGHTYREIFGVWPRGMADVQPRPASWEVAQFVRSKDIRFARSRKSEATNAA